MKKMILVILILGLSVAVCFSGEKKKEEKFEVSISIVYNAISEKEALEKAATVLNQFKNPCKKDIRIKMVTEGEFVTWFTTAQSGTVISSEGDITK